MATVAKKRKVITVAVILEEFLDLLLGVALYAVLLGCVFLAAAAIQEGSV